VKREAYPEGGSLHVRTLASYAPAGARSLQKVRQLWEAPRARSGTSYAPLILSYHHFTDNNAHGVGGFIQWQAMNFQYHRFCGGLQGTVKLPGRGPSPYR
jgi:hypothetical protein